MSNTDKVFEGGRLVITHTVAADLQGMRLDAYLKIFYKRRSREQLKTSISDGRVVIRREQSPHLSAGKAKPSSILLIGDRIDVIIEKKPEPPVDFNYWIIHEDEALLVIDKPANLPVHPAGSFFFNSLLIHLRTNGYQLALDPEKEFFLAHRIDKETSGVIVLTKSAALCDSLAKQFRSRTTWKRYLAIVHGKPETPEFTVDLSIRRATNSRVRLKMETVPKDTPDALPSLTEFRVLETVGGPDGKRFSLVECIPKTGRQHQIRLHLAAVGFPIVGDKLYSLSDSEAARFYDQPFRMINPNEIAPRYVSAELQSKLMLDRHALHAAGIRFKHPITGELATYESELREDLRKFMDAASAAGS